MLTAWLAVVAVLGVVGLGIDGRLSSSGLQVSGSESSRAHDLTGGNFGDSATVPILLQGPPTAVKQQGTALATALAKRPGVRVLSPWTASSGRSALRPSADRALLLLTVAGSTGRAQALQQLVATNIAPPVRATVTGQPLLTRDGTRSSLAAVHRAELIALPLLLLALLLVFRSPLAAAIPAAFGAATIAASTGALALLAVHVRLDAFALAISCMVGLALAVDYSLLLVSRVREELAEQHGRDIRAAVAAAAAPTTRTVAVAAAAIVVAMAVAAAMSPGTALLAAALAISVVAVLSAATAMVAVPAMLVLAGRRIDLRPARRAAAGTGASARLARAATRRPALGALAALLLVLASVPVLSLRTGAPSARSLPSDSAARARYDAVSKAIGAGWTEPFEIVAVTRRGAVTTAPRLAELERVQRRLARDPAVRAVLGPGAIARSAARLRSAGRRAVATRQRVTRRAGGRLRRLDANVSTAAHGVRSLRSSLASANTSAGRVAAGSRNLLGGVGTLRTGLDGAGNGARRLASKLADVSRGASGLAARSSAAGAGARDLRGSAGQLSDGLDALAGNARTLRGRLRSRMDTLDRVRADVRAQRRQADDALAAAERSLPPDDASAVRARAALREARQALEADPGAALDEPLHQLALDADYAGEMATATPARDAARLATAVGRLTDSADVIARRVRGLGDTVGALTDGSDALVAALERLDGGATRIGTAFSAVRAGADGLANGVRTTEQRTGELASGLASARSAVRGLNAPAGADRRAPQSANASFFDSGYFLLAALESGSGGTPFGVNVDHGGQGARIVVVPRYPASDARTRALYERLRATSASLGKALGAESAVGGPSAVLADYDAAAAQRLPLIVLVLTLVTALLLAILLRSIVVPLVGVALNLLAVGATLGLLALLFQGDAPLLGGPGEIDAVAVTAIFGVVFALSIDYQVFIISRVREEWLRCADEARAVQVGLSRTARVVTGAALSMLGVFVAFALADVASLRQFGVGLAIAVVLDATLVRLVLLPAALTLVGRWAWWTPRLTIGEPVVGAVHPAVEQAGG